MSQLQADEVVALLEAVARIPLPPDTTDVTDLVEEVEEQVVTRLRVDESLRRGLIDALESHPDARVRAWVAGMVEPSVHLTVAEPERLHDQPGVPITPDVTPTWAALTLSTRTDEYLSFGERRRVRTRPWTVTSAWFFGDPQASETLGTWPTGGGTPLPFWVQLDLEAAESNVAPHEFSRVGLPTDGVLQLFADVDTASEGDLVAHRVVLVPSGALRSTALSRPRGLKQAGPVRLVTTDTMATLPHEDDVDEVTEWSEGDRFDYRVLKQVIERDPYARNAQVEFAGDTRCPAESAYLPMVPVARLGGHLLASRTQLRPALQALDCDEGEVYPLFDLPLESIDAAVENPNRARLVVLLRRSDLGQGVFSRTVAFTYTGPLQPLPHD